MKHSLIANEISSVMGIVNGTTNYMLTRMVEDGLSYDDALKEAQQKASPRRIPPPTWTGSTLPPRLPSWPPLHSTRA